MQNLLLLLLLLIATQSKGAAFLSKWLLSSVGRRQNPGSLWQCPTLPPDMTYCSQPQLTSYSSSPGSVQEANVWIALLSSNCHPQAMKFVCTVYNPVCLHSHQIMPILPCREFCNEVHRACVSRMYLFGFMWPQQVDCNRFPSEETSMCVSSKRESVTCAPCVQEASRENIIKKYCQADVVVKSQISGVAAFGNTSSLLVTFDKVSERLLPQPPLPSTGNTKPRRFFAQGALSHGFMDTNDERLQLLHQARRVKPKSKPRPQATVEEKKAVATVGEQADQPNVFPKAQTTISPKLETTDPTKSAIDPEAQKAERRKRRREERNRGKPGRRRRDKRSSFFYYPISKDPIPGQNMLLECAGCSLQLPTSPMAPNSATRWLVMAKSLEKSRINGTVGAPNLQITSLMPWQKDTPGFRDALRDIRNIPRAILCNPNTKVELNFDGFQRSEQTTPPPFPQRYPIRTSWSRQGWAPWQRTPNPTWNLPSPFEGLFQNDAGSAAASAGNREKKKRRRQMQRRRKNQTKNTNQRTGDAKKLREEERRLRRKARKERLARMTPAQRMAWTARRRARRARRKELESRRRLQQRPHNLTNGTNSSLL